MVVIDDKYNEAKPLIRALWSYDIPVLYFSGKKTELPETPISGVRIVFLDMELAGMAGQSIENKCSTLMNVLRKTISRNNGPYLIMAWSRFDHLLQALKSSLDQRGRNVPRPFFFDNMEKSSCLEGHIPFEIVSKKLSEKLKELPLFNYLFTWEELVSAQIPEVTKLLCSKVNTSSISDWRKEVNKILYNLALANSGEALEEKEITNTQSSMRVLNSVLRDYIEKRVSTVKSEFVTCPDDTAIDPVIQADLNTKIHLRNISSVSSTIEPGNLYYISHFKILQECIEFLPNRMINFKSEFFDRYTKNISRDKELGKNLRKCKLVLLEASPVCDFTQKKWKATRLLPGLMVPKIDMLDKRFKAKAKYLHSTPCFLEGKIIYKYIFNSHYLVSIPFSRIKHLKPKYQIRLDLLSTLQDELAMQISRKGIINVHSE